MSSVTFPSNGEKPKFDPNKPYKPAEDKSASKKPRFNPNKSFQPVSDEEVVKETFKVDVSKLPQYSSTEDVFAQEATSTKITLPKERELAKKAQEAQVRIANELLSPENKGTRLRLLQEKKYKEYQQNIPVSISDQPKTESGLAAERLLPSLVNPKEQDFPVTEEEIQTEAKENLKDEGSARRILKRIGRDNPGKTKEIERSVYELDATRSVVADPNAAKRYDKILKNSREIEKGKLIYDVETGALLKPENTWGSAVSGWKAKNKAFADFDLLFKSPKEKVIEEFELRRKNADPDEPMSVPEGKLAEYGQMIGGTPLKSIVAGAATAAIPGAQEFVPVVSSVVGAYDYGRMAVAQTFDHIYNQLRNQNVPPEEAYEKAIKAGAQAGGADAASVVAMSFLGSRISGVIPRSAITPGVRQATVSALKNAGVSLTDDVVEGLLGGATGAITQAYKNWVATQAGVQTDIDEGVVQQMEANLVFTLGITAAAKGGKKLGNVKYKFLLNAVKKADDAQIDATIAEMVQKGEITELEAQKAKEEIKSYKEVDSRIPENVSDEARIKIQDKIKRRDELDQRLENTDKSFHPEIKEKIKVVEEDIQNLAQDRVKKNPPEKKSEKTIASAIEEGRLEGMMADIAKKDPEGFLKMVADQAYGRTSEGTMSDIANAEYAVREQFGDEIVDTAKELFPLEQPKKSLISVIRPEEGKNITETITIKPKEDAVSIQGTEEIPVLETPGDSGAMGEGISKPEELAGKEGQRQEGQVAGEEIVPPEIPAAASRIHVQRPETELSFRGLQNIANEFSLTDVEGRPRKTDIQLRKDAEIDIDNWRKEGTYNEKIEGITRKAEEGDVLTDKQRVIMEQHLANAVEGYRQMPDKTSPEAKELFGYVKRLKDAGEKTRSEAGAALRIPTFRSRPDASIEDFMLRQAEISKVGELTDQQIRTNEKEFNEISAAEKAYQDKIDQLEAENAKLKLQQDIKKKVATKGPKRTKEEYAKERKDILGSIKKKLDESKGQLSSTVVPYADVLFKIAPDVAKLVKNLVEEGIDNLPALVKAVHAELKQFIDPITEKDAQDLIGGVYNKKKRTRTELTARLRDLKDEAKYLSKYQELKSGVEPKSENQKIKRNQQIEQLKKNIKEHDLTKIASAKSRINKEITELQEKLAAKDYSIPEKSEIKLDKEAIELKDELIKLRKEREIRLAEEEYANRAKFQKIIDYASIPARELRTIWSSFDLSMPARQGLIPTAAELLTNPKKTAQRSKGMLQAAGSEKFFDRYMHDLKSDPTYKMMEESGVAISDPNNINSKEEVFQSKYVQKIPGIGTYGIKGSERAAAYWLNSQRKDLFLRGVDLMEQNGRTFENSPEVYKKWASVVNTLTGRGELVGSAKNASEFLSTFLFSPKLMASRLALFNPAFYAKIPKELRIMYVKDFAKFLVLGSSILATAKMFGAESEADPRSSDFGKIKLGNTRWDIWGGLQQYVRLFAQIASMSKVGKGGKETDLWEPGRSGERPLTGVLQTFLRSKSSPVVGTLWDISAGENIVGEKVTLGTELWKLAPILVRDIIDAGRDEGVTGIAKNIPAIIGVGVQTYDSDKPKTSQRKSTKRQQNKRTKNE